MLATNYFKKEFPEYIDTLCANSNDVLLTGSAVICPAVVPKDIDIMLLVNDINQFLDKYELKPNATQLELSDKEHRKILFQYICDNDTLTLG